MKNNLRISFLGGVGEIGKNMSVLEYKDNIILVDCGMSFPTHDMPGIDVVVPDITYLKNNKDKIKGIVLTHGHEDHIGAIPYLYSELGVPVYATETTLAIVDYKMRYNRKTEVKGNVVQEGATVKIGCFNVEFIKVCHSIPGACSIHIVTPIGSVFFTGDFKMDYTPIDGKQTDVARLAEIGNKGVLLMMGESTNVERAGHSASEESVGQSLSNIFDDYKEKRMIVATFASNIYRVQQIMNIANRCGRKVVFSGKSMLNIAEIARNIGELNFKDDLVVDMNDMHKYRPKDIAIICTGSQGEPMSALSRMSMGKFNKISIGSTDVVVLSSSPIPGNERMVYNVINNLFKLGANVIYESMYDIHVSGHAFQQELKLMLSLIKPKFFIPVHGEYRHLKKHSLLAESVGISANNIMIPKIGNMFGVGKNSIVRMSDVPSGKTLVDGIALDENGESVVRDRVHLSECGFVIVFMSVSMKDGIISSGPEIITRGQFLPEEAICDIKKLVTDNIKAMNFDTIEDYSDIKANIRRLIKYYISNNYRQYPMIIPIILES